MVKQAVKLFVLLVLFFVWVAPMPVQAQEGRQKQLRVAYSDKTLLDVDVKDATAAMRTYLAELGRSVGLHAESHIYGSLDDLIKDVKTGKIDMFAVRTLDYLRSATQLRGLPAITNVRNNKSTVRYLVLVPSSAPVSKLADLRRKRMSLVRGDDVGPLFLNLQLIKAGCPEMKDFFSSIEEKPKPSQLILSVFFGQSDACLVEDTAFRTVAELNPQVGTKLKVIAESPDYMTSLSFFRPGLAEDMRKLVLDTASRLGDNPRGKQILMLFKCDSLATPKESDMDSLRAMIAEYERLKRQTRKERLAGAW